MHTTYPAQNPIVVGGESIELHAFLVQSNVNLFSCFNENGATIKPISGYCELDTAVMGMSLATKICPVDTLSPTRYPTTRPTKNPSNDPTNKPSARPTTKDPTPAPTGWWRGHWTYRTVSPTQSPSDHPTSWWRGRDGHKRK